jgi:NAD(P)-dependent dehydrogenase (short-subunit alcohol dehydrogenase family)
MQGEEAAQDVPIPQMGGQRSLSLRREDCSQHERILAAAREIFGGRDIQVNNAGIARRHHSWRQTAMPGRGARRQSEGRLFLRRRCAVMRAGLGKIVNISSVHRRAAIRAIPTTASPSRQGGCDQSLALELALEHSVNAFLRGHRDRREPDRSTIRHTGQGGGPHPSAGRSVEDVPSVVLLASAEAD